MKLQDRKCENIRKFFEQDTIFLDSKYPYITCISPASESYRSRKQFQFCRPNVYATAGKL